MLPNSLTIVLPFISVFSTHPPVSVYGTGGNLQRLEAFLDNKVLLSSGLRLLTSLECVPRCDPVPPDVYRRSESRRGHHR